MNNEGFIAKASATINAPISNVWDALINPDVIKKYMFGTEVVSDWKKDSPIVWKGMWEGKPYEDKGVILEIEPQRTLKYSHFSPLSGAPELLENYHTLTYELSAQGNRTLVVLSQDNNPTEEARDHSQKMWGTMLVSLKNVLEEEGNSGLS